MPFIPRQVKPPARLAITCKVPEETARMLKHYAEFLDSTQEYVIVETLRLAFRRDKEFQAWLATTHPETRIAERGSLTVLPRESRQAQTVAGRSDARGESSRS
jgi:predicted transcriptional regulator